MTTFTTSTRRSRRFSRQTVVVSLVASPFSYESKLSKPDIAIFTDWIPRTPRQKATFVEEELEKLKETRDLDAALRLTYVLQGQFNLSRYFCSCR